MLAAAQFSLILYMCMMCIVPAFVLLLMHGVGYYLIKHRLASVQHKSWLFLLLQEYHMTVMASMCLDTYVTPLWRCLQVLGQNKQRRTTSIWYLGLRKWRLSLRNSWWMWLVCDSLCLCKICRNNVSYLHSLQGGMLMHIYRPHQCSVIGRVKFSWCMLFLGQFECASLK